MRNIKSNYIFKITWLFFLVYFLNFLNISNTLVLLIGASLFLVMIIYQKMLRIDIGICLLTITLMSYYLIVNGIQGIKYSILYIPLIVYVLANYMIYSMKQDKNFNRMVLQVILALIVGFTIYGLLNSYMYYAGYVVPGTRRWQDFWSHEIVPGTQHTVYFLPMMAMFLPAIVFIKERKWKSIIVAVITVFFCYTSLVTKSRMPLLIFVIVFFVQGILYAITEWQVTKKVLVDKRTWILAICLMMLVVIGFVAVKDTAVMSNFLNNMGKDGGILNNVRFVAQRQAISQLFDYPMGGRQMDMILGNYCHNTWLDMANAAGLIPFFAFTAYTVYTLYELLCIVKKEWISTEIKMITVGIYSSFFLYFCVEPALDASIHYLTPWIFLNGVVHAINSKKGV